MADPNPFSGAPEVRDSDTLGSQRVIDIQDSERDRAVRIKSVENLPRAHGSMDNAIQRAIAKEGYRYHSDQSLPLYRAQAVLTGPTTAIVRLEYRRYPGQPGPQFDNSFTAAQWRQGNMSLRWIQAAADEENTQTLGSTPGGVEGVDIYPIGPMTSQTGASSREDQPGYWLWQVEVSRIFVPFYTESDENPITEISAKRGHTNDDTVDFDGVQILPGQLRFDSFTLDTTIVNGMKVRSGTYQFTFSTVGFVEQYPVWVPDDENEPDGAGQWKAITGSPYPEADITDLPGLL